MSEMTNKMNHMNDMNQAKYPNKPNGVNYPNYPMANPVNQVPAQPCAPSVVCAAPPVNKELPANYDPAAQWQKNYYENIIVPHIHPSHTTHLKHTHYTHKHFYPHTESVVCTTSCEDVNCGPIPCPPCPPSAPFGRL